MPKAGGLWSLERYRCEAYDLSRKWARNKCTVVCFVVLFCVLVKVKLKESKGAVKLPKIFQEFTLKISQTFYLDEVLEAKPKIILEKFALLTRSSFCMSFDRWNPLGSQQLPRR